MYTASQSQSAILTGDTLPSSIPASIVRAFELSRPTDHGCGASDACISDATVEQTYAALRTMGNPAALRITQGQGDVPPMYRVKPFSLEAHAAGAATPASLPSSTTTEFVSYKPLEAAVLGMTPGCAWASSTDTYKDDRHAGFMPSSAWGYTSAGPRPEQIIGTYASSVDVATTGELPNPRPYGSYQQPQSMNLVPIDEAAAMRKENACRVNRVQQQYVLQQLKAANML